MADIFAKEDAIKVIARNKWLLLGDSLMRNIYKDMVWLVSDGGLTPRSHLCQKGEKSFQGDRLIYGSELTQGRNYKEIREYDFQEANAQIYYAFLTRAYSSFLEDFLQDFRKKFGSLPDVILFNSCLWDINRWGPDGPRDFKHKVTDVLSLFEEILPKHTQLIFVTTPPISVDIRGGFMIEQLEFQRESMRFNVMEANKIAAELFALHDYDVLDMHYHFMLLAHRRATDGLHWNPDGVRLQTNLILTHYSLSHGLALPGKVDPSSSSMQSAFQFLYNAQMEPILGSEQTSYDEIESSNTCYDVNINNNNMDDDDTTENNWKDDGNQIKPTESSSFANYDGEIITIDHD